MHNVLIETGRYSGKIAIDTEFVDYSDEKNLYTDEDRRLTYCGLQAKHSIFAPYFKQKFDKRLKMYVSSYTNNGNLLIESPYYSFLIDLFEQQFGNQLRVLHVRRSWQDVVASMVTHPHLKILLEKPISKSCDFVANYFSPVELQYAEMDALNFVKINYHSLSIFDKAAFKRHCFISAYESLSKERRCVTLDFNISTPAEDDFIKLGKFCGISTNEAGVIESKYKPHSHECPKINEELAELLKLDDIHRNTK